MLAASLAPAWGVLAAESGRGVGEEVVGGQPVPDGKYPFMVSVQYGSFGSFQPPLRRHAAEPDQGAFGGPLL
jgi:hypothetical protein